MITGAPANLWWLLLGLAAFLAAASAIGAVLARGEGAASPTVQNLNARINAWWVMVTLMALALVFGQTGAVVLFGLCSFAALREFLTLTDTRRADHLALAAAFFVVLPVQYGLVAIDWYGLYSIFIPVYAFLLLPIISALRGDTTRYLSRIAEMQWALMVCVFCVSHVPALLTLTIPGFEGQNVLLIAFLVVVVQGSDVAQYIWGKLFGRRRIAPALSPSKTVEGFAGGALTATLLGAGLSWLTPFTPLQAAGMALVVVLMGFFGGLVMSAIKRDRGVKDWGSLIPGHGGFIDRLDSVIFAAPIFFHLTRWLWSTT
jgi:phosphatidate cytidylyltransferase